jgi:CelD/BcsL family acetyltransferase involved in cellulose biosynthesis
VDARVYPDVGSGSATSGVLVFEVVTDAGGFAKLKEEWRGFFERVAAPHQLFQSHAFLALWARHYLEAGDRLRIVVVRRVGRVVAILPLVLRQWYGIRTLRLMGFPAAQFGDVLLDDGLDAAELGAIEDHIRGIGADVLVAPKVRTDAALLRLLSADVKPFDQQEAPFADLEARIADDGPGEAYPPKARSNHRRRLRRLKEAGAVRFRSMGAGNDARVLARLAVEMKRDWLREHALYSPTVSCARFAAFFEDAAGDMDSEVPLYVTALEHDGRTVAIDLSFDCKGHSFGHVHAMDGAMRQDGIGQLLVDAVFRAAKARGSDRFELMAPADAYKMRHADGVTGIADYAVGFTVRGHMAAQALRMARPLARKALRVMPRFVRKALTGS